MNFWKDLPKPFLILAPMEDVTDTVFREIVCDIKKPDVLFTEFTSVDGLMSVGKKRVMRSLLYTERQRPVVAQIWGSGVENYTNSTKLVDTLGFDGVDINMGCPDRGVIKKNAGSGLIRDFEMAKQVIDAVKQGKGDMAISVKTRLGFDKVITDEWISFLLEQNLDAITVHGRIATEMSKNPADWNEIKKAVALRDSIAPNTLIIGNGDVKSYTQAIEYSEKYKVDGVMIGRGIFGNPWIFEKEDTNHTTQDYLDLLLKHTKLFIQIWGNTKNFHVLKKFYKMYVREFRGADELRADLMLCNTEPEVIEVIKKFKF
jgi:tRNA-dihydrouridine synthase